VLHAEAVPDEFDGVPGAEDAGSYNNGALH
jgi:hypothetical protein